MSAIDLAILGMVLEAPKSAYEIQKDVVEHNFSKWTRISVPSVYKKVLRLQEQGYLQSAMQPGSRAALRAVYSITDRGREYFNQLMWTYASQSIDFLFDFNVVIANLGRLESTAADLLLKQLRKSIMDSALCNLEKLESYKDLPLYARTIFEQQQLLYKALQEWLGGFEAEYKENE